MADKTEREKRLAMMNARKQAAWRARHFSTHNALRIENFELRAQVERLKAAVREAKSRNSKSTSA